MSEPLHLMPVEKWGEIKKILSLDFPRSISVYMFLENMENIISLGLDYGVKVYCPFGDIKNGIIELNVKKCLCEIIIQCPKDDTKSIKEALRNTKLIHWTQMMTVPFAPKHVMDCVKGIINERKYKIDHISVTETFILLNDTSPYDTSRLLVLKSYFSRVRNFSFSKMSDRLKLMPIKKWGEIKSILKWDFPRSIYGYSILDTMECLEKKGLGYGKVYCPMGDPFNGIVVLNSKRKMYEVIIQCPRHNTSPLEEALGTTKHIDWTQQVNVPFVPKHVVSCLKRIINDNNFKMKHLIPSITFILDKNSPPFDVSLPHGYSFHNLTLNDLRKLNEQWPHKWPGSDFYFELLIKANFGFGLFKENELVTCVFNKEGELGTLYTLKEYQRHGYAKLALKLMVNMVLKNDKLVHFSCDKSNTVALNMYKEMGFKPVFEEEWCYFTGSENK